MPGANPIGQLAKKPITKHANAAARHVPTKIAPWSIPLNAIICGFTNIMYAMVINVVNPAKNSFLMVVWLSWSLKIWSKVCFINF